MSLEVIGSWGVITTLRCRVEHTVKFVNYYLNSGVSHLLLYFDDEDDPAIPLFESVSRVTVFRCSKQYWREGHSPEAAATMTGKIQANMAHGQKLLRAKGIEWAICLDSDELLHLTDIADKVGMRHSVADVLESQPMHRGIVHVRSYESILTSKDPQQPFSARWFRLPSERLSRTQRLVLKFLNRKHRTITRNGYFGHIEGKSFFRTNLVLSKMNHHAPEPVSARTGRTSTDRIALLHYDCPPVDIWIERWRRRISGQTIAAHMGPKRRIQFTMIAEQMRNSDEAAEKLYTRWFLMSRFRLLQFRLFRLIADYSIPEERFSGPILYNEEQLRKGRS